MCAASPLDIIIKILSYSEIAKPSCLIKELKLLNFELTGPITKYGLQKVG